MERWRQRQRLQGAQGRSQLLFKCVSEVTPPQHLATGVRAWAS